MRILRDGTTEPLEKFTRLRCLVLHRLRDTLQFLLRRSRGIYDCLRAAEVVVRVAGLRWLDSDFKNSLFELLIARTRKTIAPPATPPMRPSDTPPALVADAFADWLDSDRA